jgi:hypothetical protein
VRLESGPVKEKRKDMISCLLELDKLLLRKRLS